MPPFHYDEPHQPTTDDEMRSILSHKSLCYVRIETKVADAETLSTRLLTHDDNVDDDESKHLCVSFDSKQPFLILSCIYMLLVTTNIIVLSSTEGFGADNWWKICNVCNVVSGYLGTVAAIYRSKLVAAITSCWWLFEMFFGVFRLAGMHWSIIPDTAVRSWFIAYSVISYIVRLLLVCSATMFISQNGQVTEVTAQRLDNDDAVVVFV